MNPEPLSDRTAWDILDRLRRLVLLVLAFEAMGLVPELLLQEHFKEPSQLTPFALLALAFLGVGLVYFRPSRPTLGLFSAAMLLLALGGVLGLGLHLHGNLEYIRELYPNLGFGAQLWKALHKGAPVLAPGTLTQMGLLGLVVTLHHPAWALSRPLSMRARG
jgi:hypothetical protein